MRPALLLFSICLTILAFAQPIQRKYLVNEALAAVTVKKVLQSSPVIDGHNDLFIHYFDCRDCPRDLDAYRIDTLNTGQTDIPRWRKGGVGGQLLNVFGKDQSLEYYLRSYDLLYRMQEAYPKDIEVVGSSIAMRRAMQEGKIAILPSLEGAIRIKNDLSLLRSYYKLGLRSVTFAYKTNEFCDGSDDTARHNGVSAFGREVIREMNRLGILVDLSHISAKAMQDILAISEAPVIFSHSNARALCDVNRNVPDEVLLQLKKNKGIIMLSFVPYFTTNSFNEWMNNGDTVYYKAMADHAGNRTAVDSVMEKWEKDNPQVVVGVADIADHFDHVKKLIGVDHIGMAGDYDGIAFTITGLENVSTYPALLLELAKRGWAETELRKITGENFLRVFEQAEKTAVRLKKERPASMVKFVK